MCAVEQLSRRVVAIPMKTKTTDSFWDALVQVISEFNYEVHTLVSDRETAINSKRFRDRFTEKYKVNFRLLSSYHKSNLSEIYIRQRDLSVRVMNKYFKYFNIFYS